MSGSAIEHFYETTVYAKGLRSLARCLWIIFASWVLLVPATIAMFGLSWAERQRWDVAGAA